MKTKVGIIGGSGLEDPQILENARQIEMETPFGKPSDVLIEGEIGGVPCVLISRHGRNHEIMPTNVNYRANLWALMELNVTVIIASTACGSLKEEVAPGHLVFPNSIFDRTHRRIQTFFDGEEGHPKGVIHLPSDPVYDEKLRQLLIGCARDLGYTYHDRGFGVCIEGPRYSTKAESLVFKSWDATLVSMTLVPEGLLAKELGIPYANVTLVTDYDCWKDGDHVTMESVMETFAENSHKALALFMRAVVQIGEIDWSDQVRAAKKLARDAVMVGKDVKIEHLDPGKYFS
ncbi:unnamed protein product, partial [Mesorhabditis belari]|uniref:S-methyl-5'-thioadenosine phosphorylase n=1 Tax=Mesorhabditis belari TaxID=2138241 RepID=A0AAF3FRI0_9BILA